MRADHFQRADPPPDLRNLNRQLENSERHEARQHLLLSPLTPKQSTFTAPKLLIWCILVLAVDLELKHAHQFELLELLVDVVQHGGEQDPSRPCPWSPCLSLACDPLVTSNPPACIGYGVE